MSVILTIAMYVALISLSVVCCSIFEWSIHRYVMHKPILGFNYAFKAHEKVHHVLFGWREDYHLQKEGAEKTIPMAWWNGPVLIAMAVAIPFFISYVIGFWQFCIIFAIVTTLYYATYEYLHWCMHLPKGRWFEETAFFKFIDNHHRIHHLRMNRNLNVVLPIADFFAGTLVRKSPREFPERSPASLKQQDKHHPCPWL